MAMVYVAFVEMLLEQGMGAALVQREDLRSEHLDAAFWMILGASGALVAASVGLSGWWAGLNRLPELEAVIDGLSIIVPLHGLVVVQRAMLQREMDFRALALRTNASVALGGAVGVGMAVTGWGVWALVAQQVVSAASLLILLWWLSAWRPRLAFSREAAGSLIGFSTATLIGRVGVFAANRSDALLMGLFFGPAAVGLYRLADRLMNLWVSLAARSVQVVALPEFSRLQTQPDALRASVLRCLRTSAALSFPPLAVVAAGSTELTGLLGERWLASAEPLTLLCIAGMVLAVTQINAPLLQSIGRPRSLAVLIWATAIPFAAAFSAVGLALGDEPAETQARGIALARVGLMLGAFLPLHTVITHRAAGAPASLLLRQVLPALAAAAVGAAAVILLRGVLLPLPGLPRLAALFPLAAGAAAASGALLLLDPPLRARLRAFLPKDRPAA